MHAWIGFAFSCTMIIMAALGKSGYQLLPAGISGTPNMEFMFFLGCAGFAGALSMLAPSHSSARLASMWSASALVAVVVALNLNGITGKLDVVREVETQHAIEIPASGEAETAEPALVNFELERTITDKDWAPFEDIDYRIRQLELQQEPQLANSEVYQENLPPR